MSLGSSDPPRQDSKQFQANDKQAKVQGGDKNVTATKDCPLKWKLTVNVQANVNARKTKLENPEVEIEWDDSSLDTPACNSTADDKASTEAMESKGARSGKCRVKAKGWYLDAEKPVSVADGDNKAVDLVLKPLVWIGFKAVDDKSGDLIENLQVKANLTGIGDQDSATTKDKPLEIEDLKPGGTCKLIQLSHDTLLWEVVGDITST
jgi:hypothetical protein